MEAFWCAYVISPQMRLCTYLHKVKDKNKAQKRSRLVVVRHFNAKSFSMGTNKEDGRGHVRNDWLEEVELEMVNVSVKSAF